MAPKFNGRCEEVVFQGLECSEVRERVALRVNGMRKVLVERWLEVWKVILVVNVERNVNIFRL